MTKRTKAMLGYVVLLLSWSWFVGIPNDTIGVILWAWLGAVALTSMLAPDHTRFLARLVAAGAAAGRLLVPPRDGRQRRAAAGALPVADHVRRVARRRRHPTERLQDAWCGDPCLKTDPPRWYDVFFTSVYATHFLVALTLAGVLWVRDRAEWALWIRRFVVLKLVGVTIYWLVPMAPPWMASRDGYIGDATRITSRGWSEIDLHRQTMVLFGMGNKTAAMPSLHAGIAFLVVFYAIWRLRSPLRWLLLLYPLAMGLTLVYYAEHYVVDILAGAVVAGGVMVGVKLWEDRRARVPVTTARR